MNTHRNRTLHRLRRGWENEGQKILSQMANNDLRILRELHIDVFTDDHTNPKWEQYRNESAKRNAQLDRQLAIYYKCKFPSR